MGFVGEVRVFRSTKLCQWLFFPIETAARRCDGFYRLSSGISFYEVVPMVVFFYGDGCKKM